MIINELKQQIELKILDNNQLIFKLTDESSLYIAKQYIREIAKFKDLHIKYIDSFNEVASKGFVEDNNLYIYYIKELKDFENIENSIILTYKTMLTTAIVIPKLEKWQYIDYIITKVPGVAKSDIEWLTELYTQTDSKETNTNYFRLDNDLAKISIFNEALQSRVFNELYECGEFNTISNLTIFDLADALMKKDSRLAYQVLKVRDYIDLKPDIWLLTLMQGKVKKILDIQLNTKATPESTNCSEKQFYYLKKNACKIFTDVELINIYKMLTNLEYKFKLGGLDSNQLIDYIVVNILQ